MNFFVVNQFGCRDSTMLNFRVIPEPKADFYFLFRLQCLKGNIFESKNRTETFNYSVRYFWDFQVQTFKFSISKPGQFEFSLIAVDNLGCADTTFGLVTVHHQTDIDFEADTVCFLESTSIRSLSQIDSGTIDEYNWTLGDRETATGTFVTHEYKKPGLYTITHFTTSNFGCKDTLTKPDIVMVRALPVVEFEFEKIFDSVTVTGYRFINQSTGESFLSYFWRFDRFGVSNDEHPYFEFSDTGMTFFKLEATDDFGCQNSLEKSTRIMPVNKVFIPTAFSPNRDRLNEVFKPAGLPYTLEYKLEIFNRWGELLFKTNDIHQGWDGT